MLFERPGNYSDLFGLVAPDWLGFLREVGIITRSEQSAIALIGVIKMA